MEDIDNRVFNVMMCVVAVMVLLIPLILWSVRIERTRIHRRLNQRAADFVEVLNAIQNNRPDVIEKYTDQYRNDADFLYKVLKAECISKQSVWQISYLKEPEEFFTSPQNSTMLREAKKMQENDLPSEK